MMFGTLLSFLKLIPASMQIAIAGIVIGGMAFAGHEARYMTVSDFTKSYVLDLKAEIRSIERELREGGLTESEVAMLEEQLAALIDELCYEVPEDPIYCKGR